MNSAFSDNQLPRTVLSTGAGFGLFICTFVLMLALVSFFADFIMGRMENTVAAYRIATVVQDVFVFIVPPLVTALLMTRLPAKFLNIDIAPKFWPLVLSLGTLIAALPALDYVIEWNKSVHLPESMNAIEEQLRNMEETAEAFVNGMLTGASVSSLLISIAIIGVLAGLSEELFFRGGLQKLLLLTRMNHHAAIWIGAIIFSAFHFQFFGFVPRMLLGAYFGYLVWWTRSLWIPIIIHSFNNSLVVILEWMEANNGKEEVSGSEEQSVALILTSLALTVIGILLIRRNSRLS